MFADILRCSSEHLLQVNSQAWTGPFSTLPFKAKHMLNVVTTVHSTNFSHLKQSVYCHVSFTHNNSECPSCALIVWEACAGPFGKKQVDGSDLSGLQNAPLFAGVQAREAAFCSPDPGPLLFMGSQVCGFNNFTALSFICIMDAFLSIMQMRLEEN